MPDCGLGVCLSAPLVVMHQRLVVKELGRLFVAQTKNAPSDFAHPLAITGRIGEKLRPSSDATDRPARWPLLDADVWRILRVILVSLAQIRAHPQPLRLVQRQLRDLAEQPIRGFRSRL